MTVRKLKTTVLDFLTVSTLMLNLKDIVMLKMRIIMVAVFYLNIGVLYAEDTERISMAIHYIAKFKNIMERKEFHIDEMILEIGGRQTSFYSRWNRLRSDMIDSLERNGGNDSWEIQSKLNDIPRSYFIYSVFNNYPDPESRRVYCNHYMPVFYDEPIEMQQWNFADRDSTILGYSCQMAKCQFRGHSWTVWFTPDIPVVCGPWKLSGLPGLILYASDDNGFCTFEAIGLKNGDGSRLYHPKSKALKSTRKQEMEFATLRYSDVNEYLKRMGIPAAQMVGKDGTLQKITAKTAILLENE